VPQSEAPNAPPATSDLTPTFGEIFSDGTAIELVRAVDSARPKLLFWDGRGQIVRDVIQHRGRSYMPATVPQTILRELSLPAHVGPFVSTRELLAEICTLIDQFVALPEKLTALVGRFVLATSLVDAMPKAPRILIHGPDIMRARRLLQLLQCVCRRGLRLAALSPGEFSSLPSGMHLTLLLGETSISPRLANLLEAAIVRGSLISKGGALRDLFGAQAILCDTGFDDDIWPLATIQIPCVPIPDRLQALDSEQQRKIVEEFQPRLLAFRISNYAAARATQFDSSQFSIPLRELSATLAAATPGDIELQSQLHELLHEEDREIKAKNRVEPNTVIVEAILLQCREAKLESIYVGEIAEAAEELLEGRGEGRRLDPGEVGRRIKNLGFATEPRDAWGVKLRLGNETCVRAHDLAHQFDAPGVRECPCRNVGNVGQID
jgi:hypothetical protein